MELVLNPPSGRTLSGVAVSTIFMDGSELLYDESGRTHIFASVIRKGRTNSVFDLVSDPRTSVLPVSSATIQTADDLG